MMTRHGTRGALVGAACLLLAACSSPSPATSPATGRAGLIIGHSDGSFTARCVDFQGTEVSGEDLLRASDLAVTLDAGNALGTLVCSIADEGCRFPDEACLCQCRGAGPCSYWAYFNWDGQNGWTYAVQGARLHKVHDGDIEAWLWLDRAAPGDELRLPPPDLDFRSICG